VEVFLFFRWVLVTIVTVTLFWPVNVPLAALAYKVRNGPKPIPLETQAFWVRSTFAALGLCLLALFLVGVDAGLVAAGVPAGIVHLILFMLYLPAAVWFVFWIFALDDGLEALSLLVIYVFLPGLVLGALYLLFDFRAPLALAESWLAKPT
jgi:hypothetical protein